MIPLLAAPFAGEFPVTNVYDHAAPGDPGPPLAYTGERLFGKSQHLGYDYGMPVGTPILAMASGTVVLAGDQGRAKCPGRTVDHNVLVRIDHGTAGDGHRYDSAYLHLSEVAVHVGDRVTAGQRIGLSGNTGCSTGPHLHLAVLRVLEGGLALPIDPYGWSGAGPDPKAELAASKGLPGDVTAMWRPGEAPPLRRRVRTDRITGDVQVARMVGADLGAPLAGEWVDIGLVATARAPVPLAGLALEDLGGHRLALPDRKLRPGSYVRVWTGAPGDGPRGLPGTKVADLAWGLDAPVWDDAGDCARLVDAAGMVRSSLAFGPAPSDRCPSAGPDAFESDDEPDPDVEVPR